MSFIERMREWESIPEVGEIAEVRMRRLDVDKSGDFLQSGENLQPVRMHPRVSGTESEIRINLLESVERVIQDRQRSFNDGTISEGFDVPRVDDVNSLALLRARPVTDDALSVNRLR